MRVNCNISTSTLFKLIEKKFSLLNITSTWLDSKNVLKSARASCYLYRVSHLCSLVYAYRKCLLSKIKLIKI